MNRTILHLDMDAFFAAVEQLDHPDYRGKPVIVGADPKAGHGRGVVATASYAARVYGIHSAMPISRAFRRCPHGIYVRGRYDRYSELSKKLITILRDFTPIIEKISIDEAFLDVSGCLKIFGDVALIGRKVKERVGNELKLIASVGIAPNKFLAKIASDLEKPDGLVIVKAGDEKAFLKDLPIARLWGVGKKTETVLNRLGISTIGQVAEMPQEHLSQRLGKWGSALWRLSHGIDERPVVTSSQQKSISQERTFEDDIDDEDLIERTLFRLSDDLSRLMRSHHLKGRTLTLKIRLEDFSTFTRSQSVSDFVDSPDVLRGVVINLYRDFDREGKKVRLLGVGVSQLNSVSGEQLGLFAQESPLTAKVTELLDLLKDKYGEGAVSRAARLDE